MKTSVGSRSAAVGYVGAAVVVSWPVASDREPKLLFVAERGFSEISSSIFDLIQISRRKKRSFYDLALFKSEVLKRKNFICSLFYRSAQNKPSKVSKNVILL